MSEELDEFKGFMQQGMQAVVRTVSWGNLGCFFLS